MCFKCHAIVFTCGKGGSNARFTFILFFSSQLLNREGNNTAKIASILCSIGIGFPTSKNLIFASGMHNTPGVSCRKEVMAHCVEVLLVQRSSLMVFIGLGTKWLQCVRLLEVHCLVSQAMKSPCVHCRLLPEKTMCSVLRSFRMLDQRVECPVLGVVLMTSVALWKVNGCECSS